MANWKGRPAAPKPVNENSGLMGRLAPRQELEDLAREGRLWAVIDACEEPAVPTKMYELGENRAVCLYRGEAEVEHADIAPFLAHVDEFLLQWIGENFWAKPWGIFAICSGEIDKLRTHFRKFLTVKDPDGEKMYFRYYDPRILKAFLPACNEKELHQLFGPLEAYVVTATESQQLIIFTKI